MRDRDEVKVFLYLSIGKSKLAYRETRTGHGLGPGLGFKNVVLKALPTNL